MDDALTLESQTLKKKKRRIPIQPGFPELERSDCTIHPSYTKVALNYPVVCRHRYHYSTVTYKNQFRNELRSWELMHIQATNGLRIHREFTQGVISHRIKERLWSKNYFLHGLTPDPLTAAQRIRVEKILERKVNF